MSAQPAKDTVAPTQPATEEDKPVAAAENKIEELQTVSEKKEEEEATAAVAAASLPAADANAEPKSEASEKKVEEATAAVAAAPIPAPASSGPIWPETAADHPLTQFFTCFEKLTKQADYNEVYGITLSPDNAFHTKLILQKYLRANSNDLAKAKEQLLDTLKWRKEFQPQKAVEEQHDLARFEGLGFILELEGVPQSGNKKDIATFNIYGAVKDSKKTFGDLEGFLRWRIGLMERSVQKLNLEAATQPIPNFGEGPDPYQGLQIHDYLSVSFLRMDPDAKAGSKKTIEVLGRYYPETLSRKFFVNVPVVMQWLFAAMKLFVAKETQQKFTVLSYGNQLAAELGTGIPKEYGGTTGPLDEIGEALAFEATEEKKGE